MAIETVVYGPGDFYEIKFKNIPSLDLPHIITDRVEMPNDGSPYMVFYAHVDRAYRPRNGCIYCHSDDLVLEGFAAKPRLVHDVVRNNLRVDIVLMPRRMSCRNCKAKFTPDIEGISGSRQMTTRLEEYLRKEVFLQPFTILSERSGLSISTISEIMDEEIPKYEAALKSDPPVAPRVLGIDEKHLSHDLRGVLVDVESGKLLDIQADNKRETMINAVKALKDWDKNIEVVTTDMNQSYTSWLPSLLPNAKIVIDKFHVIKNVQLTVTQSRKALVEYRRKKLQEVADDEERARQSEIFSIATKNWRLFNYTLTRLAREGKGEKKKMLATVINEFPEFKMLHNLRYYSELLYEQTTFEDAERVWNEWYDIMPSAKTEQDYADWCDLYMFDKACFEAWKSFTRTGFLKYKPYILNYFISPETRFTNAATEGINSMIEDISIQGKGYSFEHLRAKCLYASLIHRRQVYRIDLKTVRKWQADDARMSFMLRCGGPASMKFFTEQKECHNPELNIYSDNAWLANSLSAEYVHTTEDILYSVKSMDRRNELPEQQSHIIYTIADPERWSERDVNRLLYYYKLLSEKR